MSKKLSVREVERLAKSGISTPRIRDGGKEPDAVSSQISERLGAPARIVRKGNRGKIEIEFYDEDDLARIVDLLS